MKTKTNELTDRALDWVVNQIEECCDDPNTPMFSASWAQGGPIIEREKISLRYGDGTWGVAESKWEASHPECLYVKHGPTPLIAAMRCYVASKLGDEVELPEELI